MTWLVTSEYLIWVRQTKYSVVLWFGASLCIATSKWASLAPLCKTHSFRIAYECKSFPWTMWYCNSAVRGIQTLAVTCDYNVHQTLFKSNMQMAYWRLKITSFQVTSNLKERYRIGKKQKSWRPQIYIKLTQSNDDDSRKHPLKYFCLKCHKYLMRNK